MPECQPGAVREEAPLCREHGEHDQQRSRHHLKNFKPTGRACRQEGTIRPNHRAASSGGLALKGLATFPCHNAYGVHRGKTT
jgi:hypothetical protein